MGRSRTGSPITMMTRENFLGQRFLMVKCFMKTKNCAVRGKVKVYAKIHVQDMLIEELYVTTTNQVIAWIKTTPNRVAEIFRRASQIQNEHFKTKVFVPKLARQRKIDVEKLLLDTKKQMIPDLRYIIRNGKSDISVLLKRGSVGKYRQYPIEKLGATSPLSPTQKNKIPISPSKYEDSLEGFSRVPPSKQSLYRQEIVEKEKIMRNIAAFIDGFDEQ